MSCVLDACSTVHCLCETQKPETISISPKRSKRKRNFQINVFLYRTQEVFNPVEVRVGSILRGVTWTGRRPERPTCAASSRSGRYWICRLPAMWWPQSCLNTWPCRTHSEYSSGRGPGSGSEAQTIHAGPYLGLWLPTGLHRQPVLLARSRVSSKRQLPGFGHLQSLGRAKALPRAGKSAWRAARPERELYRLSGECFPTCFLPGSASNPYRYSRARRWASRTMRWPGMCGTSAAWSWSPAPSASSG